MSGVGIQPLLLLTPVAEPDSHHLLLHAQAIADVLHLLACRLGIVVKGSLQRHPDGVVDAGAFLAAAR